MRDKHRAMLHFFERVIRFLRRKKEERNNREIYQRFLAGQNMPWTPGYDWHKKRVIEEAIRDGQFNPDSLANGYGWRLDERVVEYPWLFAHLPKGPGKLLDAGSSLNHPYLLTHPRLAEKRCYISTLAPEASAAWDKGVSYVYEDLRDISFRDNFFDWVVCISTLEHIGLDNTLLYTSDSTKKESDTSAFAECIAQLKRVLTPGGTLFLSVPYGAYANHGWFQVFDAQKVDEILSLFAPTSYKESVYQYHPEGWAPSTRTEAASATYFDIHKTQQYDPDYAAASRAIVCLQLTK